MQVHPVNLEAFLSDARVHTKSDAQPQIQPFKPLESKSTLERDRPSHILKAYPAKTFNLKKDDKLNEP